MKGPPRTRQCLDCLRPIPVNATPQFFKGHARSCRLIHERLEQQKRQIEDVDPQSNDQPAKVPRWASYIGDNGIARDQSGAGCSLAHGGCMPDQTTTLARPHQEDLSDISPPKAAGSDTEPCTPSPPPANSDAELSLDIVEPEEQPDDTDGVHSDVAWGNDDDDEISVEEACANSHHDTEVDIAQHLRPDQVAAWMVHGLSNAQKKQIFRGLRLLDAMARARGMAITNPLHLSSVTTPEAYERVMDRQAAEYRCKYRRVLIPIESSIPALRKLPPVPLYIRDLAEALSCAVAATTLTPGTLLLSPQSPTNTHPDKPPNEDRVEHPMQGSFARAAHRARTDYRVQRGSKLLDSIRPLLLLGIFYDKSLLSEASSKPLFPVCLSLFNVEAGLRASTIQAIAMIPTVRAHIDRNSAALPKDIARSEIDAAEQSTLDAVWDAVWEPIHRATFPTEGVKVNFGLQHEASLSQFKREAVTAQGKAAVQVHCDTAVCSIIVDSMEALSTFGAMARFHCRGAGATSSAKEHAGCILCHTPTFYYGHKSSELASHHKALRKTAQTEAIRTAEGGADGGKEDRDRLGVKEKAPPIQGKFFDSEFVHGSQYQLWGLDELHHIKLGIAKRQGVDLLPAIIRAAARIQSTRTSNQKKVHSSDICPTVNEQYKVAHKMIIPPFVRPPPPPGGGIVGAKGGFKRLKAAEVVRVLRVFPHIVDSIDGYNTVAHACGWDPGSQLQNGCFLSHLAVGNRLVILVMLLARQNLPFTGWTKRETDMMQRHIDEMWLPSHKKLLLALFSQETADQVLKVFKVHMTVVHAVGRFMSIGGVLEYTTDIYEAHHKKIKQAARQTGGQAEVFDRDQTKRVSHTQSFVQAQAEDPSFRAIAQETVKLSQIHEKRGRICMTQHVDQAASATNGVCRLYRPIGTDTVSIRQRSQQGGSNAARMFYLVLQLFAEEQWIDNPTQRPTRRSTAPCNLIQEAAGLHGPQRQRVASQSVQASVVGRIREARLGDAVTRVMEAAITLESISAAALNVLMTPELLYLPDGIVRFLRESELVCSSDDIERTVLRMCFVSSHMVHLNFHHTWDVDQQHPQQVRVMNRASHLNFFMTDRLVDEDECRYQHMLSSLMDGVWRIPDSKWVFLLCSAFTMLVCNPSDAGPAFKEFKVRETHQLDDETVSSTSASFSLVRWCHRICPPALSVIKPGSAHARAATQIDPLSIITGSDRLSWARPSEAQGWPNAETLNDVIQTKVDTIINAGLSTTAHQKVEDSEKQDRAIARAVKSARSAMERLTTSRLRADDAFAKQAYCDVQATSVVATPVAVMPVFTCERTEGPWLENAAHTWTAGGAQRTLQEFSGSQGAILSKYHQFRLNLLIQPRCVDGSDTEC